ncbi:MAG: hypothetical protein GYB67_14220, partial [Chloroflexi bacterium]|nr:hypothetical protein [Chloroflexota bacterium]
YAAILEAASVIETLKAAHKQTGNESVKRAIEVIESALAKVRAQELELGERDFEEILNHPELYPHAVRTWAFLYRNKEIS